MRIVDHPLYKRYANIRLACYCTTYPDYQHVGAKGIIMDWSSSRAFIEDIEAFLGPCPGAGYKLGRKDHSKNYTIKNLEWCTSKDVGERLDHACKIKFKGRTLSLKEWSEVTGICYSTLVSRRNLGWSVKDMLTIPPVPGGKRG